VRASHGLHRAATAGSRPLGISSARTLADHDGIPCPGGLRRRADRRRSKRGRAYRLRELPTCPSSSGSVSSPVQKWRDV
jgi:hypothetical protein